MPSIRDCIVLHGPDLIPHHCRNFAWDADTITAIEIDAPAPSVDEAALVVIPGLYNSHTHMGDSALPDGATGRTLEQAFFRPAGYKYTELAKLNPAKHLEHVTAHLRYMAQTGTVCHIDFREQGLAGAQLLRTASAATGVDSIILSQLNASPFESSALDANTASLPPAVRAELIATLAVADGFSESTMNDLTDPAWQEIREITQSLGKRRAIHCLENNAYRDVSLQRTGRGDLIRALDLFDPDLIIHLTVASAAEIQLIAERRKTAVLNPRANANLGLPLPPIADLLRANVNLLLGTDNGMLNSPSILAELDFTYKVAKSQFGDALSPDPTAILRMATTNVAAALGGDHYGRLETSLPASFAVLDFTAPHLKNSRHTVGSIVTRVTPADVLATYRLGQPLWTAPSFCHS